MPRKHPPQVEAARDLRVKMLNALYTIAREEGVTVSLTHDSWTLLGDETRVQRAATRMYEVTAEIMTPKEDHEQ